MFISTFESIYSRCYSEKLSNLSFERIREIYSTYEQPSCSVINGTEILYLPETESDHQQHQISYTFDYLRIDDVDKAPRACEKWIYKLDYNYHSMTSDVRLKKMSFILVLRSFIHHSSTGCAIRHGNQHWDNRYSLSGL